MFLNFSWDTDTRGNSQLSRGLEITRRFLDGKIAIVMTRFVLGLSEDGTKGNEEHTPLKY
jgi:hypothetical protein